MSLAANGLLRECAMGAKSGGIAMELGDTGDLGIIMTSYTPRVSCRQARAPPMGNCWNLLDTMMTSRVRKTFGNEPGVFAKLPYELFESGHQCKAVVRTTAGTDKMTFYDMWEAIVAVTGMCVRFGNTGSALQRGEKGELEISIELDRDSATVS
ncbi:MAG: hypothetical protein Q9219_005382 [cf. Caloplaca sp. 3 TL-2023]